MEADLSESRRFVREEEVTSEREQTLRNIIDEGKASEEIGGGEEEGGEPFVESLLDRQHQKPGIQGNHNKFPNQNKKVLNQSRSSWFQLGWRRGFQFV